VPPERLEAHTRLGRLSACRCFKRKASYGCGRAAGPSASTRPSGSVIETKSPPGSPLRIGLRVMLTLSPDFTELAFHPARSRNAGEVISTDHVSVPPLALGTSRSIHECGLVQRNSFTMPFTVTDLVRSTPAAE